MSNSSWPKTNADAVALMQWREMGTSNGIKHLRLLFSDPENPENAAAAMSCVDLERTPHKGWQVVAADGRRPHSSLQSAKKQAVELALVRIRAWGYLPPLESPEKGPDTP